MLFLTIVFIGSAVYAAVPRPEHPRPDFRRDAWENLNGEWNFAFDADNRGESEGWFKADRKEWPRKIVVPYPWESKLSGIAAPDYQGVAWYQRTFKIPGSWRDYKIYLNFGAVDWSAKVWVNGVFVGEHAGGYTPFAFEINKALVKGSKQTVTVKATDFTNREHPVGKQIGWYTTTSGIWQTVYLEACSKSGSAFIADIDIKTAIDGTVDILVEPSQPIGPGMRIEILPDSPPDKAGPSASIEGAKITESNRGFSWKMKIPNPQLWSPKTPNLYFIKIDLWDGNRIVDTVHTYFGIREVSREKYRENRYEYIYLNGKPFYILSALDQAFHPDGIYTYPTDQVIQSDVRDAREFGFNNLRIHIKADEPRFYYWADRLGLTVLYDLPCFIKFTDVAKETYEATLREAYARDKNHPSIIAWVLFNEIWGLERFKDKEIVEFVKEMFDLTKRLDDTRLIEDNSPDKRDHIITDINSWHFYIYPQQRARQHIEDVVKQTYPGSAFNFIPGYKQDTQPLINSEFGGISSGMGDRDISWCFHYLTQEQRRHQKICGYLYTELQDIEWEHNGFLNYDRSRKVFGYEEFVPVSPGHAPFSYRDINTLDFLVLDATAGQNIHPIPPESGMNFLVDGAVVTDLASSNHVLVPVSLCLYSGREGGDFALKWELYGMDRFNLELKKLREGRDRIEGKPYCVTPGNAIDPAFPLGPEQLFVLYAWVEDGSGNLVARNFWVFHNLNNGYPRVETKKTEDTTNWFLRWNPTETSVKEGIIQEIPKEKRESLSIPGPASVTYTVNMPKTIDRSKIKNAQLQIELAACAGIGRIDWKERVRAPSTPQTDVENRWPSELEVWVNGERIERIRLENDPADYRGVLSNIFEYAPPSSYGYLTNVSIGPSLLKNSGPINITLKTAPGTNGGIRIFGARSGRYPVPPTLIIEEKN